MGRRWRGSEMYRGGAALAINYSGRAGRGGCPRGAASPSLWTSRADAAAALTGESRLLKSFFCGTHIGLLLNVFLLMDMDTLRRVLMTACGEPACPNEIENGWSS